MLRGLHLRGRSSHRVLRPPSCVRPQRNGDLREEIGWDELVRTVAGIRDSLTPEQQAHLGITAGNYGEQGAIEMLGPAYHLPRQSAQRIPPGCVAIPHRNPPRSSLSGLHENRLIQSSLDAGSRGITETPKASKMRRAASTPTSSSVALRANLGPSYGSSIRTSAEVRSAAQYSNTATR